jgi:hypothetical protein
MTLSDWLKTPHGARWTTKALSQALGAGIATVYCWKSGRYRPSLRYMEKLGRLTQGKVRPDDWFPNRHQWASAPLVEPAIPRRIPPRARPVKPSDDEATAPGRAAA